MFRRVSLATEEIRLQVIDALRDPDRCFLDVASSSHQYLDLWGMDLEQFIEELRDELEHHELHLKPKTKLSDSQKYHYVIPLPEEDGYPAVDAHVTISPKGEPMRLRLAIHSHNTGHKPLERIPIETQRDEE